MLHSVSAGGHIVVGGTLHSRSDLEELKDYLARAVAAYEAQMYAHLMVLPAQTQPYKFLSAFGLEDAAIFCGRHAATEKLYNKVCNDRLTVLHARSGAGKTSLLQAGLSSRLIREGRLPLYVHGYEDPVLSIKRMIASTQLGPWPKLLHELPFYEFMGLVCATLSRQTQELVIILDQFEQFFLLWPQLEARTPFIKALGACYDDHRLPLRFIIALRKDYYSDLGEFESVLPHLNVFQNQYRLKDMSPSELQEAITGPLAKLGISVTYDATLLTTLLTDLARPDMELPLLQMICTRLYETRDLAETQMTLKAYEALGRAEGVLTHYLNDILADLPGNEEILVKNVLKALVRSDGMKQKLSEKTLLARTEAQKEELERVLARLMHARLLRQEKELHETQYELVHEYLTTEIIKWFNVADQELKHAEELLQRELTHWRIHHEPIPRSRLEILYIYRERFKELDAESWECLITSAISEDLAIIDWVRTADERGKAVLLQALNASDAKIRRRSILALGELEDSRAVEPLLAALHDDSADVRRQAAEALGKLGDPRAVEPLLAALHDASADVRRWAAEALGKLRDPRAVEPLISALHDANANVRRRAAEALGKMGDPRAVEPLAAALRDRDADVRKRAAAALGKLRDLRAVEPLVAHLHDKAEEVRKHTVKALEELGASAFEPLVAHLHDETEEVRRRTVETLGEWGDSRAIEPLISALHDDSANVRGRAAEALGGLGDSRAIEPLISALHDDSANVRGRAAEALKELGASAIEALIAALHEKAEEVRRRAAEILGKLGDPRAVEPLIAALHDASPEVRWQAAGALGELGDPQAVEPLISALHDEDTDMRWWAAGALGELNDSRAVEPLIAALHDSAEEVRWWAAGALSKLNDAQAVEPLATFLQNTSTNV